jgi:hypothetical protein
VATPADAPRDDEAPTETKRRDRRAKAEELPFIHPGQMTVLDLLDGGDGDV